MYCRTPLIDNQLTSPVTCDWRPLSVTPTHAVNILFCAPGVVRDVAEEYNVCESTVVYLAGSWFSLQSTAGASPGMRTRHGRVARRSWIWVKRALELKCCFCGTASTYVMNGRKDMPLSRLKNTQVLWGVCSDEGFLKARNYKTIS